MKSSYSHAYTCHVNMCSTCGRHVLVHSLIIQMVIIFVGLPHFIMSTCQEASMCKAWGGHVLSCIIWQITALHGNTLIAFCSCTLSLSLLLFVFYLWQRLPWPSQVTEGHQLSSISYCWRPEKARQCPPGQLRENLFMLQALPVIWNAPSKQDFML